MLNNLIQILLPDKKIIAITYEPFDYTINHIISKYFSQYNTDILLIRIVYNKKEYKTYKVKLNVN
jgi:hypothetical protein